MTHADSPEAGLSKTEYSALKTLNNIWPSLATMTPAMLAAKGNDCDSAQFVDVIQTLSDKGMVQYEAFLAGPSSGPKFLDMVITARGKAALHEAELAAEAG